MKKELLLMLFMLSGMMSVAQTLETETMKLTEVKGDPMLGTKDRKIWMSEHARIEPTNVGSAIILTATENIFINKGTKIGIYNKQDSLIGMSSHLAFTQAVQGSFRLQIVGAITSQDSLPMSKKNNFGLWVVKMDDMLKWVQDNEGTLRIVTVVYGDYYYDIRLKFKKED